MKKPSLKYNLPKKVTVIVEKGKEGGYIVEFPELPGCYTQAVNFSDLHEQVTDAILTYFDVPRVEAKKLAYVQETPIVAPKETKFDLFIAA